MQSKEEQALIKDFINEKLEAGVLVPAQLMLGYNISNQKNQCQPILHQNSS